MSGRTYLIIWLMLAVSLLVFNMSFVAGDKNKAGEISRYEYIQLEAAMNLYPEVAEAMKKNFEREIVTVAEYHKIMRHVGKIGPRPTVRVSALKPSLQ